MRTAGQPTVILAQTKKGYGMGQAGQGRMTTHQKKKLEREDLIDFRNRFQLPLSDEQAAKLAFFRPAEDSAEMRYLRERRQVLGGWLPRRRTGTAGAARGQVRRIRAARRGQGDEHDDGLRAHADHAAEGCAARPAR